MIRAAFILAALGCSIPLTAVAQASPVGSSEAAAPIAYVAPAPPAPPAPAPSAAPPSAPLAVASAAERKRQGLTVEVNAGVGRLRTSPYGDSYEEGNGGALAAGVGFWFSDRLAIMGRANIIRYSSEGGYGYTYEPAEVQKIFAGVSGQYWISDSLWGSAGLGFGHVRATSEQRLGFPLNAIGIGLDLRIGANLISWTKSALNLSIAISPVWTNGYDELEYDGSWMGLSTALLLGIQAF